MIPLAYPATTSSLPSRFTSWTAIEIGAAVRLNGSGTRKTPGLAGSWMRNAPCARSELPATMSGRRSLSRSATAIEVGANPAPSGMFTAAWKLPSPLPRRKEMESPPPFAVTMSGFPSRSTSAASRSAGPAPAVRVTAGRKAPGVPGSAISTVTVPAVWLAVARSGRPSPSKSAVAIARAPAPAESLVSARKEPTVAPWKITEMSPRRSWRWRCRACGRRSGPRGAPRPVPGRRPAGIA